MRMRVFFNSTYLVYGLHFPEIMEVATATQDKVKRMRITFVNSFCDCIIICIQGTGYHTV